MKNLVVVAILISCPFPLGLNQMARVPHAGTERETQGGPNEQSDADFRAVKAVVQGIIAADNIADVGAVAPLYADDAIWLPPNGEPIRGKSAILSRYQKTFAQFTPQLSFHSDEMHVCSDWAFDRGTTYGKLVPKDGGQPISVNDKYLMILRRSADGTWRIARLMWSPLEER